MRITYLRFDRIYIMAPLSRSFLSYHLTMLNNVMFMEMVQHAHIEMMP